MVLKDLLSPTPLKEVEEKKKLAAKMIAADKARAAALLQSTLASLNKPSVTSIKKHVII